MVGSVEPDQGERARNTPSVFCLYCLYPIRGEGACGATAGSYPNRIHIPCCYPCPAAHALLFPPAALLLPGEEAQDRSDVEDLQRFAADLVRATRQYLDAIYTPMQVRGERGGMGRGTKP